MLQWSPDRGRTLGDDAIEREMTQALAALLGQTCGCVHKVSEEDLGWGESLICATTTVRTRYRMPMGPYELNYSTEPVPESSVGVSSTSMSFTVRGPEGQVIAESSVYCSVNHVGTLELRSSMESGAWQAVETRLRVFFLGG